MNPADLAAIRAADERDSIWIGHPAQTDTGSLAMEHRHALLAEVDRLAAALEVATRGLT